MDMPIPGGPAPDDEADESPKYVQAFQSLPPEQQTALVGMLTGSPDGAAALVAVCPELSQLVETINGATGEGAGDQDQATVPPPPGPADAGGPPPSARASVAQAMGRSGKGY